MQTWSFLTWSGGVLTLLFGIFVLARILRRRVTVCDRFFLAADRVISALLDERRTKIFMATLIVVSAGAFIRCYVCESRGTFIEFVPLNTGYFYLFSWYFLRIFPLLVGGALLSGVINRYFQYGEYRLPSSMLGAGLFAAFIPICSCTAVPLAHSLLLTKKMTLRAVITFLVVVPVLNPFVIFFGTTVIGWQFTAWRIAGVLLLGMTTGFLLEKWIGIKETGPLGMEYYSCRGCSSGKRETVHATNPSVLLLTYRCLVPLVFYALIGVALGTAVAKYLPPSLIGKYLSSNTGGLFLASVIGVPLFLCSGEEILILKPLLDFGLPMGHAVAFTIAGNGICFASLFLLVPTFGKKATIFITVSFFVGTFLIGLAINLIGKYL